jgi:hypothetical protein
MNFEGQARALKLDRRKASDFSGKPRQRKSSSSGVTLARIQGHRLAHDADGRLGR